MIKICAREKPSRGKVSRDKKINTRQKFLLYTNLYFDVISFLYITSLMTEWLEYVYEIDLYLTGKNTGGIQVQEGDR